MVLETALIIAAALCIAFGFFFFYNIDREIKDTQVTAMFFGGLVLVGLGILIFVKVLTWPVLKTKLIGLGIALIGYFLFLKFPDSIDYQPSGLSWMGVIIGLAALVVGLYFVFR